VYDENGDELVIFDVVHADEPGAQGRELLLVIDLSQSSGAARSPPRQ